MGRLLVALPSCLPRPLTLCAAPAGLGPLRPMHLAAGISTACLLPLLLIELTQLSRLSVLGSTSTLLVIAMVLALLGLDPSRQAMPQQARRAGWACRVRVAGNRHCLRCWARPGRVDVQGPAAAVLLVLRRSLPKVTTNAPPKRV